MKVLITGGSGFIGTNTVQYFLDKGWEVLNLSRSRPRNKEHDPFWYGVSVANYKGLRKATLEFEPEYIIHLAGRTDMDGGNPEDYSINLEGTQNIIKLSKECPMLKKLLFTSSSSVCRPGHIPINERDYCPVKYYGQSKAEAEKLIWEDPPECDWSIIRPTSIWGPWQTTSYIQFFQAILAGRYFHIGKCDSEKTFGYVGNTVFQIDILLHTDTKKANKKVYCLGDYEPYNIRDWSEEIAVNSGQTIREVPYWLAKCGAIAGDLLNTMGVGFPLTSRRLKNMKTNSILDLQNIQKIAYPLPFTREAGVKETIKWIQNN